MAMAEPQAARGHRFEDKRQRILDAATSLLNERGIAGTTFQDVAAALALKTTSVVYYFRYKEQLVDAVFADTVDRLAAMVRIAATAPTPRDRVALYLELFFDQTAQALLGRARPLANLSEIRALDEAPRAALVGRYQALFREVRAFFGACDDPARKRLLTARTQLLNEALFWSAIWLPRHSIGDFDGVRRRMFDILDRGLATAPVPVAMPATVPTPTVAPAGRAAVLRVATRLINRFGYKGASVDRIMREMQLTKGSFYHHVEAKDDLVLLCFRDSYHRLAAIEASLDQHGARWDRLAAGLAAVLALQFAGDSPLLRSTALQALPEALRGHALDLGTRESLWLAGALVEGMQDGSVRLIDPAIGGHIIMSTINSAYDIRGWAGGQPLAQAVADYGGLLAGGIFD
jgi:AcrR family transcriptional regulator